MPLTLTLKPNEKIIIGETVITNGDRKSVFTVNTDAIILREKDIITKEEALSPALKIYYVLQLMYMQGGFDESVYLHPTYHALTKDFMDACPNEIVLDIVLEIGALVLGGKFFQAMKLCKDLIAYEQEVMNHVS